MKKKSIECSFEINEWNCPYVDRSDSARVKIEYNDTSDELNPSIEIAGNREGLHALAEMILAVAYCDNEGYHMHIDSETFEQFYRSNSIKTTTISMV